jgi:hypothetical protein
MGTVTGLTAARMLEIEAACIVAGAVSLGPGPTTDHLILTKHDGSTVDAGNVRGPQGIPGNVGPTGPGITWRGTWNPGTAYTVGDGVVYNGSSYRRSVSGTTATLPDADTTNWSLMAQKGTDGSPSNTPIEAWHNVGDAGEPAFQNGWANFASEKLAFKKLPDGTVRIRGMAVGGAATAITVFTLPVGYRPSQTIYRGSFGSNGSTEVLIDIRVAPDGTVQVFNRTSSYNALDMDFIVDQATFPASIVSVTQEGWHNVGAAGEPAFQNAYVNAGSRPMRFRKDPAGRVQVQGDVSSATATDDTPVFTLPVGYRPDVASYSPLLLTNGAAGGFIHVNPDGTVSIKRVATGNTAFIDYTFWVAQTTFPAGQAALQADAWANIPSGWFSNNFFPYASDPQWTPQYRRNLYLNQLEFRGWVGQSVAHATGQYWVFMTIPAGVLRPLAAYQRYLTAWDQGSGHGPAALDVHGTLSADPGTCYIWVPTGTALGNIFPINCRVALD